jgi:hypothetical protein
MATMTQLNWEQLDRELQRAGWRPELSSYQIRNRDGTPGGWVAQVHIWHDGDSKLTVTPLLENNVKIYDSKEQADKAAVLLAVSWLRGNVPAVRQLL